MTQNTQQPPTTDGRPRSDCARNQREVSGRPSAVCGHLQPPFGNRRSPTQRRTNRKLLPNCAPFRRCRCACVLRSCVFVLKQYDYFFNIKGKNRIRTTPSNAPISHHVPCGRATPRWSVAGQLALPMTASIAGLPDKSPIVCVRPP